MGGQELMLISDDSSAAIVGLQATVRIKIPSIIDAPGVAPRKSWQQKQAQRKCVSLLEKLKREQRYAITSGRYPAGIHPLLP